MMKNSTLLRRESFEHWFNVNVQNAKSAKYLAEMADTTRYREYYQANPQRLSNGSQVQQNIDLSLYPIETVYEFFDPEELLPLLQDCRRERFADDGSLSAALAYYILWMRLVNPYRWNGVQSVKGDSRRIRDMLQDKNFDYEEALRRSNMKIGNKQLIVYGAPGTGKSFFSSNETKQNRVIRTTFHPDSDYSSFIGSYKPTMVNGKIVYQFVAQAFMNAYIESWKYKAASTTGNGCKPVMLVIEEINRGNCAQIFGDLFQLLDRAGGGFSDYPIEPDVDLGAYIKNELSGTAFADVAVKTEIDNRYDDPVVDDVLSGKILLLPDNLYIWATMNTSDQSLFPMDSAFKRRWDWKYIPIEDKGKKWKIRVGTDEYRWWSFLKCINDKIAEHTSSEDKQLGYFFAQPRDGGTVIDTETFIAKVIFYLWKDVFRDDLPQSEPFKYTFEDKEQEKEREIRFTDFYQADLRDKLVGHFLEKLGVEKVVPEQ